MKKIINFLFIFIYIFFLNTQVVLGKIYLTPAELEHAIEIIIQRHMKKSLKYIPEQLSTHIGGYFDRMEFRLRCRDGIISNYFTKGRGAVLSDFVLDSSEPLYICVPRDGIIFKIILLLTLEE